MSKEVRTGLNKRTRAKNIHSDGTVSPKLTVFDKFEDI